ncbi:MAG: hypothetical protein QOG53_1916 [Frankiales bacterium]|nr:hypothetical protein [Frankiales bacterium]
MLAQEDVDVELIVVVNGGTVDAPIPGAQVIELPENIGVPAGRNHGVACCTYDVVLFLDDDGYYPSPRLAAHVREEFAADPRLGIISFRIQDPGGAPAQRRHVPRLRAGNPLRSSDVTTFLGGACAVSRAVFEEVGGYPENFFYCHEETDFAWRALDAGYRISYDADAVLHHPALPPTQREAFLRLDGRNRAFLARRNLPWLIAVPYLANWAVITAVRARSWRAFLAWTGGLRRGLVETCGERRPIKWRTVWRMTRLGRPPLL